MQAAVNHLLAHGTTPLIATVTVGNHASDRVLQKTGFSFIRVIPNNDTLRGVLVDDAQTIRKIQPHGCPLHEAPQPRNLDKPMV